MANSKNNKSKSKPKSTKSNSKSSKSTKSKIKSAAKKSAPSNIKTESTYRKKILLDNIASYLDNDGKHVFDEPKLGLKKASSSECYTCLSKLKYEVLDTEADDYDQDKDPNTCKRCFYLCCFNCRGKQGDCILCDKVDTLVAYCEEGCCDFPVPIQNIPALLVKCDGIKYVIETSDGKYYCEHCSENVPNSMIKNKITFD